MGVRRVEASRARWLVAVAGALSLAAVAVPATSADAIPGGGGGVAGRVTDEHGQPVAGINVMAYASVADYNGGNGWRRVV